jgi:hypothetical protein
MAATPQYSLQHILVLRVQQMCKKHIGSSIACVSLPSEVPILQALRQPYRPPDSISLRQATTRQESDAAGVSTMCLVLRPACGMHQHHTSTTVQGKTGRGRSRGLRTQSRLLQHSVLQVCSSTVCCESNRPHLTRLERQYGHPGWLSNHPLRAQDSAQSNTCTAEVT